MDSLIVARVRRPHGVRGSVLVMVESDRPEAVFQKGRTLELGTADGDPVGRQVTLRSVRKTPDALLLDFEDIGDRDAADTLRGHTLLIDVTEAAPASPNEVHHRDLIGLEARTDTISLGTIDDILDLANGKLLVVRSPEGRERLIPIVPAWIDQVDTEGGFVAFDLPDGFLDL